MQLLDPEVGDQRVLRDRKRVEPDQVARRVEDHRAVLGWAELGSHEDVALAGGCAILRDRDSRRPKVRARAKGLYAGAARGDQGELPVGSGPQGCAI